MVKEHSVVFTPSGLRGKVPDGISILDAARKLGADLDSVCGGRGICSKCTIKATFGNFPKFDMSATEDSLSPRTQVEERMKVKRGLGKHERLGCQTKILGDVIIDIPEKSQVHKQVIRKEATKRDIVLKASTKLFFVEVPKPDIHNPSGDFQRLKTSLETQWSIKNAKASIKILQKIQKTLRKGNWKATCAIYRNETGDAEILNIWAGFFNGPLYGIAIDLGSTTIAGHLCDLSSGEVVCSAGSMNPQIRFGEDLMSRVSFAMMNETGTEELKEAIRTALNKLCKDLLTSNKIQNDLVPEIVLVCNPVMHHLFLGIDPTELGQAPFALATSESTTFSNSDLDLISFYNAKIHFLPCIAGHVGADAAAVVLSECPNEADENTLIIDVGTNAELILGNKKELYACSSPTGPAFEGAQISSGQRAAPGAIEKVRIDNVTKCPIFKVIGCNYWSNQKGFSEYLSGSGVSGICGSGIIEAIAEMRIAGILDSTGLIGSKEQTGSNNCLSEERTNSYILYDNTENGGPLIKVTNNDVRAIQLAKAALFAGARLLMDEMGIEKVDKIVLAGAFGAHISAKHAMVLGMIPDCELGNVVSAGNAAGTGATIALLNSDSRSKITQVVKHIIKVETAMEPRFQEYFVSASAIPNSKYLFEKLEEVVTLPRLTFNQKKRGERRKARI